jgi:hypothetical protein
MAEVHTGCHRPATRSFRDSQVQVHMTTCTKDNRITKCIIYGKVLPGDHLRLTGSPLFLRRPLPVSLVPSGKVQLFGWQILVPQVLRFSTVLPGNLVELTGTHLFL